MRWSHDFETDFPEIDRQHRCIFEVIQRLYQADENADRSQVRGTLQQLERLARCHFDYEEHLMRVHEDPDSARHVAEHANLISELKSYHDATVFRNRKLAQVLGNWLTSHTLQDDRPLVQRILQSPERALEPASERALLDAFEQVALEVAQSPNRASNLP